MQEQALSDGKIQSCAPHLRTSLMAIGANMIPTRLQVVFEVIRISMVVRTSRTLTQSSVFRTWQGWLSMSDTGPGEGTLRVFPDVLLSTAYLVLRPFFRPVDKTLEGDAFLDKSNWVFDISDGSFQGIQALDDGFDGQRLTDEEHPHLRLDSAIVSMPRVKPGDMAFWHCDVVHSVEQQHDGPNDSSVMYIPAVPLTPQNVRYLARHRDHFRTGMAPPDFPQGVGEGEFINKGLESDIYGEPGRLAMGLEEYKEREGMSPGAKEAVRVANAILSGKA
ncbi:hypothetical protein FRC02_006302 [Tulasnella sp. 418]|nr:hypothetical protein FRC02_006302 [Tulasnella sp. 418]